MSDATIEAEVRTEFGKGFARRARAAGKIPAVLYEAGNVPTHITLPAHQTTQTLKQANVLLTIVVDGKETLALPKDIQRDPVRQIIEHVDLFIVRKGEKVEVEVPIVVLGEPFSGAMMLQDLNTLRVKAEATDLPESIEVDIEGLKAGVVIHVKDLNIPAGAEVIDDEDQIVVNIVGKKLIEEDEDGEESGEATPAAEAPAED